MELNEVNYLNSLSDLIIAINKMDGKVSKLFEVITGDKELNTDGLIIKIHKLEEKVKDLEHSRSKMVGIFIAAGVSFSIIWELTKQIFHK
jgi:hypothetical protein